MPAYLADLDQIRRWSADANEDDPEEYLPSTPTPTPPPTVSSASDPEEDSPSDAGSPLFGSPAKPTVGARSARVNSAYDAVQSVNAERPVRTKPGLWRTLATLGVGLGAGYSNATGKFKHQDVGGIVENGINGPYNRKMSDWQQKQKDSLETLKAAQEADKEEQDYLDAPVKRDEMSANAEYLRSHTDLNKHQIQGDKARDRYLTLKDGSVYDTRNQSTIWKPQTPPEERIAFAKQQGWDPSDPAIQGWIMDGKSPGDTRPDRVQMITGDDGIYAYDTVTKQKTPTGIKPPAKTDPIVLENMRENARDDADNRRFDQQNRRNDQTEIDRLQNEEQKLHKLRGALGREMLKGDNDFVNDPVTGKPMLDGNKKPLRKKQVWQQLQDQYDQATAQAQDLNAQQKRLAQRNGGGASSDPLNLRK